MCGIHRMEYYAGIKEKELLPFATAWMDLESIMLSKISQSKKNRYHMMSLIYGIYEQHKLINKNIYRDKEASNRLSNFSGKTR